MRDRVVDLSLPKFTTHSSLPLNDALPALGMPQAFGDRADFSAMTPRAVRFDHPFLFLVRDLKTGAIVFATQVHDPAAG